MKYIFSIVVLLLGAYSINWMYATSPKTAKKRSERPIPVVKTQGLAPRKEKIFLRAYGTVIPARKVVLQSEVEGRIINQSPNLVPGGLIQEKGLILEIDPKDYELLVKQRESEVEEAKFEMALEEGRQVIARQEWKLLRKEVTTSEEGRRLALRIPHKRRVKFKLQAAQSALETAKLAVARTKVRSPFNCIVIEERVEKGQLVSRQYPLSTLVGTDQFWVLVSLRLTQVVRILIPRRPGEKGASVRITLDTGGDVPVVRQGYVLRLLGDLDSEGRMARVLVAIDDPLMLQKVERVSPGKTPVKVLPRRERVMLGCYVKVEIDVGHLEDVYAIPRTGLREGDQVWVVDAGGKLQIRKVEVKWRRKHEVLVSGQFDPQDRLIVSKLQSPLPGMKVVTQKEGK